MWFTEEMKGFVTFGGNDPTGGYETGKRDGTALMFRLTIRMEDIETFVADPDREGSASGWIACDRLGGRLPVERGIFNLFVAGDDTSRRKMLYRLWFTDGAGHPLTLSGVKDVHDGPGFDVWRDTSTLYVSLYRGHISPDREATAEVAAVGVLHILAADFARQLTTFGTAGPSVAARAGGLARFGKLFLGELWKVYGRGLTGGGVR